MNEDFSRMLSRVFQDPQALSILDVFKPSFRADAAQRRMDLANQLREGQFFASLTLLEQSGLLQPTSTGWVVPEAQKRLVYHTVCALRDDSAIVQSIFQSTMNRGLDASKGEWLDLACGAGSLLRSARRSLKIATTGTDLDPQALEVAELADGSDGRGYYHCCHSHSLPLESKSVDVVISIVSFQHFWVSETMKEIVRCLRRPGMVFFRLHGTGYYTELALRYLRQQQFPLYALRCLLQGLQVHLGLPQNRSEQNGWYKLEVPINPGWMKKRLHQSGFQDIRVRIIEGTKMNPVFYEISAVLP